MVSYDQEDDSKNSALDLLREIEAQLFLRRRFLADLNEHVHSNEWVRPPVTLDQGFAELGWTQVFSRLLDLSVPVPSRRAKQTDVTYLS